MLIFSHLNNLANGIVVTGYSVQGQSWMTDRLFRSDVENQIDDGS